MTIDELKREAMRLDVTNRAALARDLLASLDDLSEAEVEELWLDEVRRRREEVLAGTVETIPLEDVLAEARARFG